ncbi:MAG: hypothetical protein MI725_03660, partial [Pirellulales bacterium]|nr:hypothetical protein [Pirellulales bacterium]
MTPEPADNSRFSFSGADLDRIRAETPEQQVEFHREAASTNNLALELADRQGLQFPLLILA